MTIGIVFETAAPAVRPAPNRTDIACFIGFVGRRRGAPLPQAVKDELAAGGWTTGPWRRSEEELESALQVAIPVESWDTFDDLYAWDERPLRAGSNALCTTYLGAAVRSFFARGGRRALIVRVGDPWPYLDTGRADAAVRRARIRALVPAFTDAGAPPAGFDPHDPSTWRGIEYLYGLRDVSLMVLPDLVDACAVEPPAPAVHREPPPPPEGFVECGEGDTLAPVDRGLRGLAAPRCDSDGYRAWRIAVKDVRAFLTGKVSASAAIPGPRRDCLFVGALPLPAQNVSDGSAAGLVFAEAAYRDFLLRMEILRPDGKAEQPPYATAASAFVQVGWPWIATRRASDLPEGLEPPDGLIAGVIAASALARGTFRSVAGTRLPEVLAASPTPAWGLGPDSPAARLAEHVCLIAPEPDGWSLASDVTTSPDPHWQPGGVSRLLASVLRAAWRVGDGMVFEPNGPLLWTRVKRAIEDLLTEYWRAGGLRGTSIAEAFDVRCDRSTMTQNDIDNGRIIVHVELLPAAAIERMTVVLALDAGGAALQLREVA
jgi:uncharacterized protein